MNSEMETLLRTASYAGANVTSSNTLRIGASDNDITASEVLRDRTSALTQSQGVSDISSLATEVSRLVEATRAASAVNVAPPKTTRTTSMESESSVGETIFRTAAMMTGVGPIVTGLMKLFGSSDPEPLPALEKFETAPSVSMEAGLSTSREYGSVRYAQGGIPEIVGGSKSGSAQAPVIQVNIQAMDSQSFLDRQEDIARAVRGAMLHSSSLNDVVMEL